MSLFEHFEELAKRSWLVLWCFFAAFLVNCFFLTGTIVQKLSQSLPHQWDFYTLKITEGLTVYIQISAYLACIEIAPVILYQFWRFVEPALYPEEQRPIKRYFPVLLGLFILGLFFGGKVIFPIILKSMLTFSVSLAIQPLVTVSDYVHLLGTSMLTFGVLFQLPLLCHLLARLGLLRASMMRKNRKYAYFTILIIAGFIAPPEITSHLAMTVPLIFLYEGSIWLVQWTEKKQSTRT